MPCDAGAAQDDDLGAGCEVSKAPSLKARATDADHAKE
jgi:hypothetical protein